MIHCVMKHLVIISQASSTMDSCRQCAGIVMIVTLILLHSTVECTRDSGIMEHKRPLHHHQLLRQRQKLLRHQNVAGCTSSRNYELPQTIMDGDSSTTQDSSSLPRAGAVSNTAGQHTQRSSSEEMALNFMTRYVTRPCAYFSGSPHEVMRYRRESMEEDFRYPHQGFTVSVWVKPEGGQVPDAVVLALVDKCTPSTYQRGWRLGIQLLDHDMHQDGRWYYQLTTDRSRVHTTIHAHTAYTADVWVMLTITYHPQGRMTLLVNGVQVGGSAQQSGDLYNSFMSDCKDLTIGGLPYEKDHFRGSITDLRMWDHVLDHHVIKQIYMSKLPTVDPGDSYMLPEALIRERFTTLIHWDSVDYGHPRLDTCTFPSHSDLASHRTVLHPPACGYTVCDDPTVVTSYTDHRPLRGEKRIRYRVVNLWDSEGGNPTVTDHQIQLQHQEIGKAFSPYNITWLLDVVNIYNSTLRQRVILSGCAPHRVGDGVCDESCKYDITGQDGGDCDVELVECDDVMIGDGVCQHNCNKYYHSWDAGDCCHGNSTETCYDPAAPNRGYLSLEEYKVLLGMDSSTHLNIYFAHWIDEELIGEATFPWQKDVFTVLGGTVVKPDQFGIAGHTHTLVHELGHNLGLWHVHRGVSEAVDCEDPCYEREPSLVVGDLCADTYPTPSNPRCRNPYKWEVMKQEEFTSDPLTCGKLHYSDTPFDNYMSYAVDNCTDHFTPQQAARMHCYVDLAYRSWRDAPTAAPVPLAPQIFSSGSNYIQLSWTPLVDTTIATTGTDDLCPLCDDVTRSLTQYGYRASSKASGADELWGPREATGAPDGASCDVGDRSWIPDPDLCQYHCDLEIQLQYPVVADSVTIWVAWTSEGYLSDLELQFTDGTYQSLGRVHVQCDTPYTAQLDYNQPVQKVRIHSDSPYVAIDAVRVTSQYGYPGCDSCPVPVYRVYRQPPYTDATVEREGEESGEGGEGEGVYSTARGYSYTDRDVTEGITYTYRIQAVVGEMASVLSPELRATVDAEYCGDGIVNSALGESCDDGNVYSDDGCSKHCDEEQGFICRGSPSHCYRHVDDGICEDYELLHPLPSSDCGSVRAPPVGYTDQWPTSATTGRGMQAPFCPVDVLIGPPSTNMRCEASVDYTVAWSPCDFQEERGDLWAKVYYRDAAVATSVLVYYASDGRSQYDLENKKVKVKLIDESGAEHSMVSHRNGRGDVGEGMRGGDGDEELVADCRSNPSVYRVVTVLSEPVVLVKGVALYFTSPYIAIAAVALRSPVALNPPALRACSAPDSVGSAPVGLYSPLTGACVRDEGRCSALQEDTCSRPAVKHAEVQCTGRREGDVCDVTCNAGYVLSTIQHTRQCVGGEWLGGGADDNMCVAVDCGSPDIPYATVHCPHGNQYGARCKYECVSPARMVGTEKSVSCASDGMWTQPSSYCQVRCVAPPVVKNATIVSRDCRRGDGHNSGERCRMKCQRGFYVQGHSLKKRAFRQRCTDSGVWSGPVCVRVQCPAIAHVYTGMYSCTNGLYVGSICTLKCTGAQRHTSSKRCLASGEWDLPFTPCSFTSAPTCRALDTVLNDTLLHGCSDNHAGTTCTVRCNDPLYTTIQNADDSVTVTSSSSEANVTCTGLGDWYPPLHTIRCVQQCSTRFIGDGFCDAVNNREFCEWDGGDCCQSTVVNGYVRPFPDTCTLQCTCRDPVAEENQQHAEPDTNHRTRPAYRDYANHARRVRHSAQHKYVRG